MSSRLQQLEAFYNEDPTDPFNLYALALEYTKHDVTKSASLFDILLQKHAHYLPTYYHAAKLFQELNNKEKAIKIYEDGIVLAKKSNDHKAIRELQSAYQELIFEA